MVKNGFSAKAAPTAGFVGLAAFEALGRAFAKVPWREATVTVTTCGLRVARKAQKSAERARLAVAEVIAEATEHVGEEVEEQVAPPAVAEPAPRKRPGKAAKRPPPTTAKSRPRKRPAKAGKRPPPTTTKSGDDHGHAG